MDSRQGCGICTAFEAVVFLVMFVWWMLGVILSTSFIQMVTALLLFPYAWYLVVERAYQVGFFSFLGA